MTGTLCARATRRAEYATCTFVALCLSGRPVTRVSAQLRSLQAQILQVSAVGPPEFHDREPLVRSYSVLAQGGEAVGTALPAETCIQNRRRRLLLLPAVRLSAERDATDLHRAGKP